MEVFLVAKAVIYTFGNVLKIETVGRNSQMKLYAGTSLQCHNLNLWESKIIIKRTQLMLCKKKYLGRPNSICKNLSSHSIPGPYYRNEIPSLWVFIACRKIYKYYWIYKYITFNIFRTFPMILVTWLICGCLVATIN